MDRETDRFALEILVLMLGSRQQELATDAKREMSMTERIDVQAADEAESALGKIFWRHAKARGRGLALFQQRIRAARIEHEQWNEIARRRVRLRRRWRRLSWCLRRRR